MEGGIVGIRKFVFLATNTATPHLFGVVKLSE